MSDSTTTAEVRPMWIGGEWVPALGGGALPTVNPTTEDVIAQVAAGDERDVERAVDAARAGAARWARTPLRQRVAALGRCAERVREHAEELALLDTDDAGLPVTAMRRDAAGAADEIDYVRGIAYEVKGFTLPPDDGVVAYTEREPYGVVGRIVPFNHPVRFAAGKIAAPLVTGNAVLLKPPEQAPLSALRLAELVADLLPPGVLNVVTGLGPTVGAAIAGHPGVPRVAFTGSVAAGRAVLRAGAEHIKSVSLELGGKNPLIVCADADVRAAASAAVAGMNFRSTMGQSCQSNSRVFAHADVADELCDLLAAEVGGLRVGPPREERTDMGPLAFADHYARVCGYVERGLEEGARLVAGGARPEGLPRGYFLEPTVFAGVRQDMAIAREEIFGPVVSVLSWDDVDKLLADVNSVEYGLTAKVWTRDLALADRLVRGVECGLVWVNGAGARPPGLPFGGFKQSGIGKEGCLEELVSYTREKGVVRHAG